MRSDLLEDVRPSRGLQEIGPHATNRANANRFGGGIVTLKLIYPLFQRFGAAALALRTLLHTDRSPSLGFMTTQGGTGPGDAGTTLHEAWNMQNASNGSKPLDALHTLNAYDGPWPGSFNHIMMGSPGRWFYTLFGGIDRDAGTALGSSNEAEQGSTHSSGLPTPTRSTNCLLRSCEGR